MSIWVLYTIILLIYLCYGMVAASAGISPKRWQFWTIIGMLIIMMLASYRVGLMGG